MSELRRTVDDVLRDPLAPARQAPSAVGFVGLDIPEDLLAAPGIVATHLPWQRGAETPWADAWLEDSFPGWARCILEDWAAGAFDFLQSVIFTRGDDASQRLYYYVTELQRQRRLKGPTPLIFDVARIPRPTSAAWTANAVARLAAELGLGDDDLAEGIRSADRRRALLNSIDTERKLRGHCCERIARASLFAAVDTLDLACDEERPAPRGRVLLAGSVPPDDGLHLAVEGAGACVVGEVHARNLQRLGPPIGPMGLIDNSDGAPVRRIAEHLSLHAAGPRSFHDRASRIVAEATARRADAAILWLYEEDEAFAWDVVGVRQALAAADIQTLVLERRRWDLSDAPEIDIGRFLVRTIHESP